MKPNKLLHHHSTDKEVGHVKFTFIGEKWIAQIFFKMVLNERVKDVASDEDCQ